MPLRTAALLSAILLVWLPTALCHEDACPGDIRSSLERLQGQLTVFQNQLSAANQCPSGWSLHKNSCYLIPEVTATWLGANSICPSMDRRARLASVHLDNHLFLEDMVAAVSDANYVYVGGARLKVGATNFGWQDGTPFDHANWAPGQPDNKIETEHCLCMQGPKSTYSAEVGQMHDAVCIVDWFVANFLCQISLTE